MLRYYRNCDEIPVYNFYKILETKDYRFLYLSYDGYDDVSLSGKEGVTWDAIYEEHLELSGDNSSLLYYDTVKELMYLKSRYEVSSTLLNILLDENLEASTRVGIIVHLAKLNYKLDEKKDFNIEMSRLFKQLKGSKNRIHLKEEQKKGMEDISPNEKSSLIEQQVALEQALSRNEIDVKKIVMTKWVALFNQAKKQAEHIKNKK